jgi:DNA processing protein
MRIDEPDETIDRSLLAATLLDLRKARQLIVDGSGALEANLGELTEEEVEEVEMLALKLEGSGIRLLSLRDPEFPERLSQLRTPPPFLFAVGNTGLLGRRCISFAGSRDASEDALESTSVLVRRVLDQGFVVGAGYARGVDAIAHQAALISGGETIAVLPEGVLKASLRLVVGDEEFGPGEKFLAISQFPPAAGWAVGRAMARNSTVVALSEALVVMSAGESGGSLEAGKTALKRGHMVFVPALDQELSAGAKVLCEEGAVEIDSMAAFDAAVSALDRDPPPLEDGGGPTTLF